jgi:PDZ domain
MKKNSRLIPIYILWNAILAGVAHGFVISNRPHSRNSAHSAGVDLETVADIGYIVQVEKPLGVVFGENRAPFNGLSIDVVEEGASGATAGLRAGDQLMAVNGQSVIGSDFDKAMALLKESTSPVELQLYRGTLQSLFTIVLNRRGDDYVPEEESAEEDQVIFDESYESPVIMTAEEFDDDTISVSQVAQETAASIGTIFSPKAIGGFFGQMFSQETIQLEDKDGK